MFKTGDIIGNGSDAGEILERVEKDPRWKTSGWRVRNISLHTFDGCRGMTSFVPDYLCWKVIVPDEWFEVTGGGLEARYVWSSDYSRLINEYRPI